MSLQRDIKRELERDPALLAQAEKLAARDESVEVGGADKKSDSIATMLVKLARERAELFHSGENCYATITLLDHEETVAIRSRAFKAWLGRLFFEREKKAGNSEAFATAVTTLEGFARFEGKERQVYVRLAEHDGKIYLDLCDEHWRAVEVGKKGWRIIKSSECPVRFKRADGMHPLPTPESGGKIGDLRQFMNVSSDGDFALAVGCLIGMFHPRGPYPVLVLHGEQGSGKSSAAKVLRLLIDPNKAAVRSEPREPRDLMIAASNGWVCAFDNISHLGDWLSDAICRMSTGGGFSTRTLYTDDEETIFEAGWVAAAEKALGWKAGAFVEAYRENRQCANDLPLETPVAEAVRKLALPWSGTASELHKALDALINEHVRRSKGWPKDGHGLSNKLRRLTPNLRQVGICVDFDRDTSRTRRKMIRITLEERAGIYASAPSAPSENGAIADAPDAEKPTLSSAHAMEGRKRYSAVAVSKASQGAEEEL